MYVQNINTDYFIAHSKNSELLYYKYHQKSPYSLLIMIDFQKDELSLEFTSKILKQNCINLISQSNIKKCLQNINELQICSIDVDNVLKNSIVTKCDVTKDVVCTRIDEALQQVPNNLSNHKKWICKPYKKGITIENIVSTPRHKQRITIYDKGYELNKATKADFLNMLPNKDEIKLYFQDKMRFELNINTMVQIRGMLNIDNNNLMSVLHAEASPFLFVLNKALKNQPCFLRQSTTLRDYERELLLQSCNYDLHQVELTVRSLISKNTPIKRIMEPYRTLWEKHQQEKLTPIIDIRTLII